MPRLNLGSFSRQQMAKSQHCLNEETQVYNDINRHENGVGMLSSDGG